MTPFFHRPYSVIVALLVVTLSAAPNTSLGAGLQLHWQDTFSTEEQQRLSAWIQQTDQALAQLVGPLPFTRHIFFHRASHPREPVPWAHTQRGAEQGVHFHVDTSHPQQAFLDDWTAPHELSHLVIPYLGERHAWLAEGFASFMQFQVMAAMGVINERGVTARYQQRFERAAKRFARLDDLQNRPFARVAGELRKQRQYPTMYWGGAVYFWQADQWLKTHTDMDLINTLQAFVQCCRASTRGLNKLIEQLDNIAPQPIFERTLDTFRSQPGFPRYQ